MTSVGQLRRTDIYVCCWLQEELRAQAAEALAQEEHAIEAYNAAKREQEDQEAARRAAHKDVADRCGRPFMIEHEDSVDAFLLVLPLRGSAQMSLQALRCRSSHCEG